MYLHRIVILTFGIGIAAVVFAGDNPPSGEDNPPYRFETFQFPDAPRRVVGVKYRADDSPAAMPLGGLGTGTVALDRRGRFTRQAIANSYRPVGELMADCGFTLRAECASGKVEKPLHDLAKTYLGHFPIIDIEGDCAETPVKMRLRAMSPFILKDARASATPAAMFRFTLENPGDKPVKTTLTFRWNTPPPRKEAAADARRTLSADNDQMLAVTREEPGDRAGCTIAVVKSAGLTVAAVETPAEASAPDVTAVSASAKLGPGQSAEMRFVLAWYYPQALDGKGKFVGHKYADWFDGSVAVAEHVVAHWDDLARRTGQWQETVYDDSRLPDWLKDQLVNSLSTMARNSSWLKDGRFTQSESFTGCPITETIVCRFYGSIPLALFFPELEKNTMRQFIRRQRDDGAIPFAFGEGENWDAPYYETQKILDSSEFILLAWRDYAWWKDKAWADEVYPAVKKAFAYALTLDTDGDGLINDELSMQYYDRWQFHGASAYTGGVWLAAIKAAAAFAQLQGDEKFQRECESLLKKAQAAFEKKLWTGQYYRLWNDTANDRRSDTCLGGQLAGQWFAYSAGLGEVLPHANIIAALEYIRKTNGDGQVWALVNGIMPDGGRDRSSGPFGHSDTATLGDSWCYAATCVYAGRPALGLPVAARLAENISLRQQTPWNTTWNLHPDTGQMLWGTEYYSNMCVWDLWNALTGE